MLRNRHPLGVLKLRKLHRWKEVKTRIRQRIVENEFYNAIKGSRVAAPKGTIDSGCILPGMAFGVVGSRLGPGIKRCAIPVIASVLLRRWLGYVCSGTEGHW